MVSEARADGTLHLRTTRTEHYLVTYWTSEQGLPQNTVNCLLQTRDGYLWAGTRYGLVRFDGARFTTFVTELHTLDPDHLDVRGLAEDEQGRLWLRTRGGLVSYHQGRFHPLPLLETPFRGEVRSICVNRSGDLWVAKRTGVLLLKEGQISANIGLDRLAGSFGEDASEIDRVFEDSQGALWVLLSRYGQDRSWQRFDPRTETVEGLKSLLGLAQPDIEGLVEDRPGRWWLGRAGELLCWEKGQLSLFDARSAWGTNLVHELINDQRGNLWVRSGGPMQLHRFANGQFTSYGRAEGVTNPDDVRCLLSDREGSLWAGTGSGGLHRLQPRQMVSLLTGARSAMDEVYSVAGGQNGRVWMATTYGLVLHQAGQFLVYTNSGRFANGALRRIRPVLEDRAGQVWFGMDGAGLQMLRDGLLAPAECPDLSGPSQRWLSSLFEDHAGTLWIGTQRGLLERRGGRHRLWTTNDGLSDNAVFGLTEGPDGSLWIGTRNGGVNQFKEGRIRAWLPRDGLLSAEAWPLRTEPDGTVWVGTPRGLNRLRDGQLRAVTMANGLHDDLAYCLMDDRHGNYWSFGNRGVWRMRRAELHAVADGRAQRVFCVAYGEADGMASAEGNGDDYPNAAALPNGELWFPTTRGVVVVDPETLRDDEVSPRMVIEEVRVDEKTMFKDGGYLGKDEARKPKTDADLNSATLLRLAPGQARVMEIRYTANTFIDPEKARFRFQLQGHDRDWREADAQRVAIYTNLRPGDYRFRVQACNHHGYWSQTPAEFSFQLAPHLYETWPFRLACGLAVLMAGAGLHAHRFRVRRRLLRLRQRQALEEERSRIGKDLHDDLGANLTGLALELDVARHAKDDPAALRRRLDGIAQSIRTMADRMREVVWTVNPHCDTLESFSAYLCQYAENFLATATLRCRLDIPAELPAHTFPPEARHHLLMVAKEALNNVAKHAVATEVRLGLHLENGDLTLTIADNGRGFPPGQPAAATTNLRTPGAAASGQGLANIRRRVQTLGGRVEVTSELGLGTKIQVRVPLRREPQRFEL